MEVVMICGYPASGKSTEADKLIKKDYVYLNRDTAGGKVIDLLPDLKKTLAAGSNVVLDNLFPTPESRKPFIDAAKAAGASIRCIVMETSIEDSQINALHRMWQRHKKFFFAPNDLKGVKDPNMFPVAVLFKYRKEYKKPSTAEGFEKIDAVKFTRLARSGYNTRALILDYDDTLRRTTGKQNYPVHPSEVEILPGRAEKLTEFVNQGYVLLGVSNQSGVDKGILTYEDAVACFERTNELLGHKIDYVFCPHQSAPPNCYCRKPQSGHGVHFIEKYKLNVNECIFVGDKTTDKTFAQRVGFQYFHPDEFFK
jgi:D-glycero-D-manno-heptose 1,7-bisphosphate phosphatase